MKNKLIALLLIWVFFLSSCSAITSEDYSDIENAELNVPSTEGYEEFFRDGVFFGSFIKISSGSYYSDGEYVYYSDNNGTNYIKVCSKPNCSHNDEDCDAYIEAPTIGCYNNHIYWVSSIDNISPGCALYRMNLDGSDHEKVYTVTTENGAAYSYVIHNGLLFYKLSIPDISNTDEINDKGKMSSLYKRSLESGSKEELITSGEIGNIISFHPANNYLFLRAMINERIDFYCYDIETGRYDLMFNDLDYQDVYFGNEKGYLFRSGEGIYELSYEDYSVSLVFSTNLEGNFKWFFCDKYIYIGQYLDTKISDDNLIMYVYTYDYEQVAKIELDFPINEKRVCPLFAIWQDKLLFSDMSFPHKPNYYAYIKDIINGEAEFHKID